MTAIAPDQATGPVRTTVNPSTARPDTRPYILDLLRWLVDVARWIHEVAHHYTVELPVVTVVAGAVGVGVFTLAAVGLFLVLASAVLS